MVLSKKKINMITTFCLAFLFFGILVIPTAHAALSDFPGYMLDTIKAGASDTVKENLSPDNAFYKFMIHGETSFSEVKTGLNAIMTGLGSIGVIMAIISLVKNIKSHTERGMDPSEIMFKCLAEFLFMIFVIVNISKFLSFATDIGESAIELISNNLQPTDDTKLSVLQLKDMTGRDDGGTIWWIQSVVILIIPYLFSLGLSVAANFTTFSILLELGVRRIFAPCIVVSLFDDGMRGPGMRYLKKYVATFIKIGVCLIVCALGSVLLEIAMENVAQPSGLNECLKYILFVVTINFTVLGFMNKGGEFANDIMGV